MTSLDAARAAAPRPAPKAMTWAGWALTGLATLFMTFDIAIKLVDLQRSSATPWSNSATRRSSAAPSG